VVNLLGTWEAEEDFEREYLAELLQQERRKAGKLLDRALAHAGRGELRGALAYAQKALAVMRKSR